MFLFLIPVLATPAVAIPLPQKQLTLSDFRSTGSRSLEPINNFVRISPSYRQVRRQGRKGENLPIKFPDLKVRDPNELTFISKVKKQDESGASFGNNNNIEVEDIESKIREINASVERENNIPKIVVTTEKDIEITTIKPVEERIAEIRNESDEIITEGADLKEEEVNTEVKHIVVSIKTLDNQKYLNKETIKDELVKLTELDTTVYINELDSAIQSEFSEPRNLIYVDAKVDGENEISGNVFSAGRPLEELESDEYEKALSILNKVSQIIEDGFTASEIVLTKKIIVAIRTASIIDEKTVVKIKNSLEEDGTDTSVFFNAPEEVIRNEFANPILPIFVSISIDIDNLVGGNVYYNSVPLEDLLAPEYNEASGILITVKNILEESILMQLKMQAELAQSSISEQVPIQEAVKSKKVVISLKSILILTEEDSAQLSRQISSQIGIDSILLVNRPTEVIQEQLRGPTVPILLDMKIDQEYQLSGNIFYNYQPAENLNGQDFDEAMNILAVVKEALTEKINKRAAFSQETTETSFVETTTELDFSSLVDSRIVTTETYDKENEDALAEPEPTAEEEPEPTAEEEPEPTTESESTAQPAPEPSAEPEPENTAADEESSIPEPAGTPEPSPEPEPESYEQVNNINEKDLGHIEEHTDSSREPFTNKELIGVDNEEGSGYNSFLSDNLKVIKDTPNVAVKVFNHGVNGVTELPGRSKSATPGVDFGLIQEITNN